MSEAPAAGQQLVGCEPAEHTVRLPPTRSTSGGASDSLARMTQARSADLKPGNVATTGVTFTKEVYSKPDMIFSIALFMFASAGMSIANKMAVMALPLECTLVLIQMAFTALFLIPRFLSPPTIDGDGNTVKAVELGDWQDMRLFAPCPLFMFAGMLLTSMFAYSHNTM
eukprot:SAG31_NODE_9294_length_1303_cov_1.238372_2_plen_169_part_00